MVLFQNTVLLNFAVMGFSDFSKLILRFVKNRARIVLISDLGKLRERTEKRKISLFSDKFFW